MTTLVQVKAEVPSELKRRTFAALALRDERFAHWLRTQMTTWLQQVEISEQGTTNARLARSEARG